MSSERFLEVSSELARGIAGSALWYRGRCNWIGATGDDRTEAALGPHLYDGTSGVALFLAEAATRSGDDRVRAAALGAIRHALRDAPAGADGLYTGPIGIAYAAARVGGLLEAEEAIGGARDLLRAWRRDRAPSAECDLIGGRAGAVAGLVTLAALLGDRGLVEAASALGDELIAWAEVSDSGWSWPAPGRRSMHSLCGFAHGAAGIGHALVELYGATGEERYRRAGEGAFAYGRSWARPAGGSWPDLRGVGRAAGRDAPVPLSPSWCHGAPGIALALARATRVLRYEQPDAQSAIAATRGIAAELLAYVPDDFSLCHGAAGAADALVAAGDPSGLAQELGLHGLEQFHGRRSGFPCGLPDGTTPGLMLGLAGIATFYLRLADRSVPSPLIIHARGALDPAPGTGVGSR